MDVKKNNPLTLVSNGTDAYIEPKKMPVEPDVPEFGGGKGGPPVEPSFDIMKAYVDSRNEAVESRLTQELAKHPTNTAFWGGIVAVIAAVFTVLGILLAVIAFGGDRFDGGMSASTMMSANQKAQSETDTKQDTKLRQMDDKLDVILRQTAKK